MSKRANEQAYPCWQPEGPKMQDGYPEYGAQMVPGLTLREHFAGLAMQGLCANPEAAMLDATGCAVMALARADALLAELERTS